MAGILPTQPVPPLGPVSSTPTTPASSTTVAIIPAPTQQTTPGTTGATSATSASSLSSSTGASSSASTSSPSSSSSSSSSATPSSSSTTPPTSVSNIATSSFNIPAVTTEISTTFISETPTSPPTAAAVNNSTSSSFFQNKAAVAGVFTVVGVVGLVILIALVTNAIRRRQARKFDKELFLATQEAAATAPNPNFLDDEDDEPKRTGYSEHTGYSDVSHGTFGQPPMEAFTMRDMGHSTAVGEIYEPHGGAAGIGVARARSARVNGVNGAYNPYAAALQEGGSPYPQFMGPQAGGPFGRGNMELGATVVPGGQQPYPQRSPPPQEYTNLGRSKSDSTNATLFSTPSQSHTSNYSQSQPPYPERQISPPIRQMSPPRFTATPANLPNPYSNEHPTHKTEPSGGSADDAAYGGYVVDDLDEEEPRRVLKIANES